MASYADGTYVARLETQTQLEEYAWRAFLNSLNGKSVGTETEIKDLMKKGHLTHEEAVEQLTQDEYAKFRKTYYETLPVTSSRLLGWTSANYKSFRSTLANFGIKNAPEDVIAATQHFVKNPSVNGLLQAMEQNVFSLKTTQTGEQLFKGIRMRDAKVNYTTTHGYAVYGNMADQKRAFDNILSNGKRFLNFDLEDVGDQVTQYTFAEFDPSLGGAINNTEYVRTGLVGLDQKSYREAMVLLDEYEKNGLRGDGWKGVTKDKEYMLREYMKMGLASKSGRAWTKDSNGRITLNRYASNEDVYTYDVETMRQGVEELFAANKAAKETKVMFGGHEMYRYEADILESLYKARRNGGLTLTSTNGLFHDIPMLERFFGRNGHASNGAMAWVRDFTNRSGRFGDFIYHLDVTSVGRELMGDDFVKRNAKAAAEAERLGEYFNSSSGNQLIYLGKDKMALVQDALKGMGDAVQKHTSFADVLVQGATVQAMVDNWQDIDKDIVARNGNGRTDASIFGRASEEREAKAGDLFYIENGMFDRADGFGYMHDAISGEYRFSNGVRVGKTGKGDIVSPGLKKNSVAMLMTSPKEVTFEGEEGEKLFQAMSDAGFKMPGEKLYSLTFALYGEQLYNGKRNTYTYMGSKDQVMRFMQDNPYFGKFTKEGVQKEIERQLYIQNRDKDLSEWAASYKVIRGKWNANIQSIRDAVDHGLLPQKYADVFDAISQMGNGVLSNDFDQSRSMAFAEEYQNTKVGYLIEQESLNKERREIMARLDYFIDQRDEALKDFRKVHPESETNSLVAEIQDLLKTRKGFKKEYSPDDKNEKLAKKTRDEARAKLDALKSQKAVLSKQLGKQTSVLNRLLHDEQKVNRYENPVGWEGLSDRIASQKEAVDEITSQISELVKQISSQTDVLDAANESLSYEHDTTAYFFDWLKQNNVDIAELRGQLSDINQQELDIYDFFGSDIHLAEDALKENLKKQTEHNQNVKKDGQVVSNQEWQEHEKKSRSSAQAIEKMAAEKTANWTDEDWRNAFLNPEYANAATQEGLDDRVRKAVSVRYNDSHGEEKVALNVKGALNRAAKVVNEDAASNWIRDMDYKKAGRILDFLKIYDDFSAQFFGFDPRSIEAQQRAQISDKIIASFQPEMQKTVLGDTKKQQAAFRSLRRSINAFMKKDEDYSLYSNTLKQLLATVGYTSEMRDVINAVYRKTAAVAKSNDKQILEGTFHQVWYNVLAKAADDANHVFGLNLSSNDAIGKSQFDFEFGADGVVHTTPRQLLMTGQQAYSFEVDLSSLIRGSNMKSFGGLATGTKSRFIVNLNERDSFGKRLARQLGMQSEDYMTALRQLGVTIYNQYNSVADGEGVSVKERAKFKKRLARLKNFSSQEYAPEVLQGLIREELQDIRKYAPGAGMVGETVLADIHHAPVAIRLLRQRVMNDSSLTEEEKAARIQKDIDDLVNAGAENITKIEKRKSPQDLAKEFVETLFERTEGVTEKELQKYGYSETEAKKIRADRLQRKKETRQLLEAIFGKTFGVHPDMGYQVNGDGSIWLTTENEYLDITKYLPVDYFDKNEGSFRTLIGGRSLATTKVLTKNASDNGYGTGVGVHSLIGEYTTAVLDNLSLVNSHRRSLHQNLKNVAYFLKKSLDPIVDNSITKFDKQDTKLGKYLDLSLVFDNLGQYNMNGAFEDIWDKLSDATQTALDAMTERLKKGGAEKAKPKTNELIAIYNDFHRIMAPLANPDSKFSGMVFASKKYARDFADNIANEINLLGLKHPEKGLVSLTRAGNEAFSEFGIDPRHINVVLSRALDFKDVDEFKELLGRDSELARTTRLGAGVLTPEEAEQRKHGLHRENAVRTTHLSIHQTDWEDFLAQKKVQDKLEEKLGKKSVAQLHSFLNESGSIINGALLDLVPKNIEQKIKTDQLVDAVKMASIIKGDDRKKEEEIRQRTNALIGRLNGQVTYKYSTDYVVLNKGEDAAWNESFKGMPTDVKMEREALVSKRYLDKNKEIVSDTDIAKILNRKENAKNLLALQEDIDTGKVSQETGKAQLRGAVDDILRREGFQEYYVMESPDAMPYRKMLLGTEKSMARFGMMPIGTIKDSEVNKTLNTIGIDPEEFKNKLPLAYLTGSVVRDENKFNALLRHHGIKMKNGDEIKLDKEQAKSISVAVQADNKKFFDAINEALHEGGLTSKDTYVNSISATEFEATKGGHSEVGRMRTRINESVDLLAKAMAKSDGGRTVATGADYKRASLQIQKDLSGVFRDVNGNDTLKIDKNATDEAFTVGRPDDIDIDKFNRVMAKYNPDFSHDYGDEIKDAAKVHSAKDGQGTMEIKVGDSWQTIESPYSYRNGKMVGKVGTTEIRAADDADQGRYNAGDKRGIKVTRRMTATLEQELYHKPSIQKAFDSMNALYESKNLIASGKDALLNDFNEMYDGIASAFRDKDGKLQLKIEKGVEGRNVNDGIIQNLKEEVIAGINPDLQFVSGRNNEHLFRELEQSGVRRKDAENILNNLSKKGFGKVGMDFVKNEYAYTTGRLAHKFNLEMQDAASAEEQQEIIKKYLNTGLLGDRVIDISHANFDTQAIEGDLNNLSERAGIVKAADRYIAVGYEPTSIMDNKNGLGTHDKTKTREKLSDLQHAIEWSKETADKERVNEVIDQAYNGFLEEQSKSVTSKGGALARTSEGYLSGSAMFKANIIRARNGEASVNGFDEGHTKISMNELLGRAKVNGISIAEHEAAGHHVNAMFVGEDFFRNMVKGNKAFDAALASSLDKKVEDLTEDDREDALQKMLKQASVSGGTGIELRQPMEYFDSVQGMHIFYDKSLSSNEAFITEAAAKGQKADKDGDTIFAHATMADATIHTGRLDKNGEEIVQHTRINQFQAAALNAMMKGQGHVEFDDGGKIFSQINRAADTVANVSTSGVKPLDDGNKWDDVFWGKNGYENQKIKGHLYNVSAFSSAQIDKELDRADEIIGSEKFQKFVADKIGINLADGSDAAEKFNDDLKHNIAEYTIKDSEDNKTTYHLADEYVRSLSGSEASEAQKALGLMLANQANSDEIAKTMARENAGINNMNTFRFRTIVNDLQKNGLTAFQSGDNFVVSQILVHMNEAFQAPKNSTSVNKFDFRKVDQAMRNFFGVNRDKKRDIEPLMNIIREMKKDGIKELKNLPVMEGLTAADRDEEGEISIERIQQALENVLQKGQVLNEAVYNQNRVGYANSQIEGDIASHNGNDMKSLADELLNNVFEDNGAKDLMLENAPLTVAANNFDARPRQNVGADEHIGKTLDSDFDNGVESIVRGATNAFKGISLRGGAMAMLGFAGAMMMAGMAGGAPTSPTPAQGQAKGIQSENAIYEIPSAAPATTKSQPQSYVINVNASTSRGRDFATTAINQAFARMQGVPAGNQMTMNIKDSSSNIGFGDIGNYISSML